MRGKIDILMVSPAGSDDDPQVRETLRSISAQSYPASLRNLVHVHYVTDEPDARTSALNAVHENAQGEYVVHAQPGVMWDGNKLEQQVRYLQDHPSEAACVHPMTARNGAGRTRHYDLSDARAYGPRIATLMEWSWGPASLMVRTEVYRTLGVFRNIDEALWEYDLRLLAGGHKVGLMEEDLAVWHRGDEDLEAPRDSLTAEGPRHGFLASALNACRARDLLEGKTDETADRLLLAALHLKNGSADFAHEICLSVQDMSERPEARYWMGIVLRRMADYAASRAEFARSGAISCAQRLHERMSGFLQQALQMPDYGQGRQTALEWFHRLRERGSWDAGGFVDMCQMCTSGERPGDLLLLEGAQEIEWEVLFESTCGWARGN